MPSDHDDAPSEIVRQARSAALNRALDGVTTVPDHPIGWVSVNGSTPIFLPTFFAAGDGDLALTPPVAEDPQPVEMVRCSYARTCLRRNADGMVALRDRFEQTQVEDCPDCGLTYCTMHMHVGRESAMRHCRAHGTYHPVCIVFTRCTDCRFRFCDGVDHYAGGDECREIQGLSYEDENEDENEESDYGRWGGTFRDAELLFDGDVPVPGLAEGKRYAALELEVEEGNGTFVLPERFGVTTDGSLDSSGLEITTPPSRMDKLVENVETACRILTEDGYAATVNCGMHAHIDLRDKKNDSVFLSHLFSTFYAIEDILFAMNPGRNLSQYCVPLRSGWPFYATYGQKATDFDFAYYKQTKTLASKRRMDEQKQYKGGPRYNAFNFHSVYYRGTLEIRLHQGCTDADEALLWIELLQQIIARVERGVHYSTLLKLLGMDVTAKKLAMFKRVFKLSDEMMAYVDRRIRHGEGMGFRLAYQLGNGIRGRAKNLIPRRARFRVTHRRCRWCYSVLPALETCRYCHRQPLGTGTDEMGLRDDMGTMLEGGFMTRQDYDAEALIS